MHNNLWTFNIFFSLYTEFPYISSHFMCLIYICSPKKIYFIQNIFPYVHMENRGCPIYNQLSKDVCVKNQLERGHRLFNDSSQPRMRNERTIMSFKVDRRDKPIKCNRESPSASFPVRRGPGPKEKPFPPAPWSLHTRRAIGLINSRNLKPTSRQWEYVVESEQKDPWRIDVHACMYVRTYVCMHVHTPNSCSQDLPW